MAGKTVEKEREHVRLVDAERKIRDEMEQMREKIRQGLPPVLTN